MKKSCDMNIYDKYKFYFFVWLYDKFPKLFTVTEAMHYEELPNGMIIETWDKEILRQLTNGELQ